MTWDPTQYLRFADHRLRPALELLARVSVASPAVVVDLGCGAGNVTPYLRARWPSAAITGVDSSVEMLRRATADHADLGATWVEADAAAWGPESPADVVFSNALLHWVPDHQVVFPRLVGHLAPHGQLAIQMPANFGRPTHTEARAVVEAGPWADRLRPLLLEHPVRDVEATYDLLRPHVADLDIWETDYVQQLSGDDPVVEWAKGSLLAPVLAALDDEESATFLDDYAGRIRLAYPRRADGTTLLPYRRQFIIATASG